MELRFIISPAKGMREVDAAPRPAHAPALLDRARQVAAALRALSPDEARALWRCSERLASLSYERLERMDLDRAGTAAIASFEGIQYAHLAAGVMTESQLAWLDGHVRILSGLYGVLRPLDGVVPHRLEMQARLAVAGCPDLYAFWGGSIYDRLAAEGCELIVNVASVEYARAVTPYVREGGPRVLTCLFGTMREGRLRQQATEAKAARGTFVRWCAERRPAGPNELAGFAERGYALDEGRSDDGTLVFARR